MKAGIMFLIGRFMAEKIAVCSCFIIFQILIIAFFAYGKGDGTVRILVPDGFHNVHHNFICECRVFPSLKHKGPKAEPIPGLTAGENLFLA